MSAAELFENIRTGNTGAVAALLEGDPSLASSKNDSGVSAVLMSVYTGRKEIRDLLLERGAILELHDAVAVGRLERVRQIVESNPAAAKAFSPDGFPVVALACVFGHLDVGRYLAGKGRRRERSGDKWQRLQRADRSGDQRPHRNRQMASCKWRQPQLPLRTRLYATARGSRQWPPGNSKTALGEWCRPTGHL